MICYEIIDIIVTITSTIIACIAAIFTYKNLSEIRKQFFEQNRGNLVFYFDNLKTSSNYSLILKNFGNSPAKLISLEIQPELDWNKTSTGIPDSFNITNCKNVFLAPNQHISTIFDFENYEDQIFQISISYETCGKTISESYTLDLQFAKHLLYTEPEIKNELSALKQINKSIQQFSDRFL